MMFSGKSLSANGSAGLVVPLIGDDETRSPSLDRNNSGDAVTTQLIPKLQHPLIRRRVPGGQQVRQRERVAPASGGADSTRQRFTW